MRKIIGFIILRYLRFFAVLQLKKNRRATIIGITGSAGKTSARQAVSLILSGKGRVKESKRANSESGIPLNILGISPTTYSILDWLKMILLAPWKLLTNWEQFDYYVVEMGIDSPDSPKNMEYLLTIISPHLAVILNAGLVHGEAFDHLVKDRDPVRRSQKIRLEIAREKMKLALNIKPTGVVVYNSDQKELSKFAKSIKARIIKVGRLKGATLKLTRPKLTKSGFTLSFSSQGQEYKLKLADLYEENFAYTFGLAIAATSALGVTPNFAIKQLASYRSPAGRMRIFPGIKHSTIIDSSYNSSPDSTRNTLKLLSTTAGKSTRLAVIGDMRELGRESKHAHKLLAEWLLKYCDQAILFGKETHSHTYPVLNSRRFPVIHFSKMSELTDYLTHNTPENARILVKGSQNKIFLERAVESLLRDKSDIVFLCRRGTHWDRQRSLML